MLMACVEAWQVLSSGCEKPRERRGRTGKEHRRQEVSNESDQHENNRSPPQRSKHECNCAGKDAAKQANYGDQNEEKAQYRTDAIVRSLPGPNGEAASTNSRQGE
jgi:hypothetical protein